MGVSRGPRRSRWRTLFVIVALLVVAVLGLRYRYGGGDTFPDRVGGPTMSGESLDVVASLPLPPGNVAVSADGRVFFTFHPDAKPDIKLAELVGGAPVAWPNAEIQRERDGVWLDTPLGVRIDQQQRLWVIDNANHGLGDPKVVAFDVETGEVAHEHHFSSDIAGWGSHLNDLVVHPDGRHVYIADASIFAKTPALVVYDIETASARRVLEGHTSVSAEPYYITVDGEPMEVWGLFAIRPGVDSIALDRKGEWLYFAAMTSTKMYRIRTSDLEDDSLTAEQLAIRVEVFGDKTVSDGITTDSAGRVYLSDPEHNAIIVMQPDAELETLIVDPRLRWPDGFSFGPNGWVYVTCSALQHVIMKSADHVAAHAPYHILRFQPGATAAPGH